MIGFLLERVAQPPFEPLTLDDVKTHIRGFTDQHGDDDLLTTLITGAREWVEDYTGRALVDQSWRLTLGNPALRSVGGDLVTGYTPGFVGYGWFGHREWTHWLRRGEIWLRRSPVLEVVSFVSVDQGGNETTIDPATYELRQKDSKWPRIVPLNGVTWHASGIFAEYRLVLRAGFIDCSASPAAGTVPVAFLQAMKFWIEANYDRDEKMMPLLLATAEQLVNRVRADLSLA